MGNKCVRIMSDMGLACGDDDLYAEMLRIGHEGLLELVAQTLTDFCKEESIHLSLVYKSTRNFV